MKASEQRQLPLANQSLEAISSVKLTDGPVLPDDKHTCSVQLQSDVGPTDYSEDCFLVSVHCMADLVSVHTTHGLNE